ncbi:MAG TPA: phage minor capsid protein [Chloroflexota bacterium]|nr:phage minor capsid protein [Chloroflexota bacterium]
MQPSEVDAIRDELARLYTEVQTHQIAELERIAGDPNQHRYRARLTEQGKAVTQALDEVDVQAQQWASRRLPEVYQLGAMEAAAQTAKPFSWTEIHRDAVTELATDTYGDLLKATRYVRRDVRDFIRRAARERAAFVIIGGETSTQAGRRLAKLLEDRRVAAIRYANGSRHTLGDYSDTVLRTKVAMAHVMGSINASREAGVRYMMCSDGAACSLYSHTDGPLASGLVAPIEVAQAYPLSHPRCARSWSPMPLVKTPAEARAAMTVPEEERQALAAAERERAKVRTVQGRLTARERQRRERLRARNARLAARQRRLTR